LTVKLGPTDARKCRPSKAGYKSLGYDMQSTCERCSASSQLVVHHKNRDISNNRAANLETLCRACHRAEHAEEIATSQRRPEVNARRGASVSKARTGKVYPKASESLRKRWDGPMGEALRAKHNSVETKAAHSSVMSKLWATDEYRAKRKAMKEQRNG
jgi:hypothetical protein